MLNKYRFKNWKNNIPSNLIEYFFSPTSNSLRIVNFLFQKVFRINGDIEFMVHYTSKVNGKISLGKDVVRYFANSGGCYFSAINGIEIGDGTIFAPGVKVISANHDSNNFDRHTKKEPIRIGNNCWLGANSVILPGIQLGNGVIVAAGAVVSKSFTDNVIIGGVPAKIIKKNDTSTKI